jgi:hypothetical protein
MTSTTTEPTLNGEEMLHSVLTYRANQRIAFKQGGLVFVELAFMADHRGWVPKAQATAKELSLRLNQSVSATHRHLKCLLANKHIKIQKHKRTSYYVLNQNTEEVSQIRHQAGNG